MQTPPTLDRIAYRTWERPWRFWTKKTKDHAVETKWNGRMGTKCTTPWFASNCNNWVGNTPPRLDLCTWPMAMCHPRFAARLPRFWFPPTHRCLRPINPCLFVLNWATPGPCHPAPRWHGTGLWAWQFCGPHWVRYRPPHFWNPPRHCSWGHRPGWRPSCAVFWRHGHLDGHVALHWYCIYNNLWCVHNWWYSTLYYSSIVSFITTGTVRPGTGLGPEWTKPGKARGLWPLLWIFEANKKRQCKSLRNIFT